MSNDLERARARIGQEYSRAWNDMIADEIGRIVDAKLSQEELQDFLADFRTELRGASDSFSLQLFLYWMERRADRMVGRIVVAKSVQGH